MLFRTLLILCFSYLLAGCCNDSEVKLASSVFGWNPYTGPATIQLKSTTGETTTFSVQTKSYNQYGHDKICGSYPIETIETVLTQQDQDLQVQIILSHAALVSIKVSANNSSAKNLDIRFNAISEKYVTEDWQDKFYEEISLNGVSYKQVLWAHGTAYVGDQAFTDLYYGKDIGLIAFRTVASKWFYLK
ncbi:hypothetical protein [Adhaeribacter aquaticus]|uniref:hypothetical protein n=1 Tax=Adhaeribacter aquaticus TaxID=299567 RepID=UPI000403526E|nr:hypothetical protein [Adhaeribacter aquaticus]